MRDLLQRSGKEYVLLLDEDRKPKRWVGTVDLEADGSLRDAGWPAAAIIEGKSSLYETLATVITSYKDSAIVDDDRGRYESIVDFGTVLHAIEEMRPEENRVGDKA